MKNYPFEDTRRFRALFTAFLTALLFLSRDTLFVFCIVGFEKSQLLMFGLTGAVGLVFLIYNRKEWKALLFDRRMGFALICSVLFLLPMFLKRDWQLFYPSTLFCIYIAVLLSYFVTTEQISKCFIQILCVLAVYSLLATYLFRIPADRGILVPPTFINRANKVFYNYLFSYTSITYAKTRNFGIYREPGVYQFFLLIGLFLNNDRKLWEKDWQVWTANGIMIITMLSTFASGGVIELFLLLGVLAIDQKWYRSAMLRKLFVAAAIAAAAAAALIILQHGALYKEIYQMFHKFFYKSASLVDRVGSIVSNMRFFAQHPIAGVSYAQALSPVENNTSSSTLLAAVFGIGAFGVHVLAWAALVWKKNRNVMLNLAYLGILAMSFNTENMVANPFLWLMPVMALLECCPKKAEKN